ncbi:hypothetical protein [Haloarchaeobius sp. HRN-SO-5]|uniref:hypothetical protein n=1 Tax=Haloarchaeobius sp. HRN-SO-5 TaxID=3446118 RepID=UPI003EBE77E2
MALRWYRRSVVLAIGAVVGGSISGCLRGSTGERTDGPPGTARYEECDADFVLYSILPDDVAREVDEAFETGAYETEGPLLYDQAVGPGTPLYRGGTFYEHRIERDGETIRISFEEWTAFTTPVDLALQNETEAPIEASVAVTDENGDRVFERTGVTVAPDGTPPDFSVTGEFGVYTVTTELADGRRASHTWQIGLTDDFTYYGDGRVILSGDAIEFDQTTSVYDRPICNWE